MSHTFSDLILTLSAHAMGCFYLLIIIYFKALSGTGRKPVYNNHDRQINSTTIPNLVMFKNLPKNILRTINLA